MHNRASAISSDKAAKPFEPPKKQGNTKKAVVAALAALLLGGFILYSYLTPDIRIAVSKQAGSNAESYVQMPMISESTKFGLPLPKKTMAQMKVFWQKNDAAISKIHEAYIMPIRINTTVEATGRQTVVTYSGTVTDKSGKPMEYCEQLVFDFVLTEKIS